MKVVIQCAGSKSGHAGSFSVSDGRPVVFVANPAAATDHNNAAYAHPDDVSEDGGSWRQRLVAYNSSCKNSLHFLPAYKLYANPAYGRLVERFGEGKIFILSAGWGLVSAEFLLPSYDITFSRSKDRLKDALTRRKPKDRYADFSMIEDDGEDVVFLGGKDYLPLFQSLMKKTSGKKSIFYNSHTPPTALLAASKMIRFETRTRTNWHYECAYALAEGKIAIGK